jgi:dolichol-phosphate mannosyltransferase
MLNELGTVPEFYERVRSALAALPWELVAVDDGSKDGTGERLRYLSKIDSRVRVLRLSRNFGHQAALTAGLDVAGGDVVVTMDADLQDPPELIPQMIEQWQRGADVVYAVRRERLGEPRWRLLLIRAFYRVFGRLARLENPENSGDFRLLDRRALQALSSMRERNRFLRGMSTWIGFQQGTVMYDRDPRFAGKTKYPLRKLIKLAADGIISFSYVPLRVASVLGVIVSIVAVIGVPVVVILKLAGQYVSGLASVTVLILLLGGVQLLTVGIIGEYLARSYDEVKRRPIYVVSASYNMADAPPPAPRQSDAALEPW